MQRGRGKDAAVEALTYPSERQWRRIVAKAVDVLGRHDTAALLRAIVDVVASTEGDAHETNSALLSALAAGAPGLVDVVREVP